MHHRAVRIAQHLALALLCFGTFSAGYADAAVVINEVAWSGTDADSADEWMELYNTADNPADITGWSLANDRSLHITLAGAIAPQSYFLLKRTDETGLTLPADQIYTGALPDDCSALTLADAQGGEQDAVSCVAAQWPAGDVVAHASMERINPFLSGSFAENWVTATVPNASVRDKDGNPIFGTPKAQNGGYNPNFTGDTAPSSTPATAPSTSSSSGKNVAALSPAVPQWHIAFVGEDGAAVPLERLVTTTGNTVTVRAEPENSAQKAGTVHWSLGNGTTKTGAEAHIIYEYPGEYVLAVTASQLPAVLQIPVTVYEPQVHLAQLHRTKSGSGDWLAVANPMAYRTDISGWSVHYGSAHYEFPANTVLAPQANAIIPLPASMRITASTNITFDFPGDLLFEQVTIADVPADAATLVWTGSGFVWNAGEAGGSAVSRTSAVPEYVAEDTIPLIAQMIPSIPFMNIGYVANKSVAQPTAPATFSARSADAVITSIIPRVFAASSTDASSSSSAAHRSSAKPDTALQGIAHTAIIDDNTVLADSVCAASIIAAAGLMGIWVRLRQKK